MVTFFCMGIPYSLLLLNYRILSGYKIVWKIFKTV